MSTTIEKKQYAEFDEYIDYQIQKTRQGIKTTDIFTAVCGVAVMVVSYLLIFVVLDHWVIAGGFGYGTRLSLMVLLIVSATAWTGWKVVLPWFRSINGLYAAKAIEKTSSELDSNLLNYVDLRRSGREVSPAILNSIEKRAAVALSHSEVDDAINRRPLLKLSYALLAVVVLFSAYTVISPKKVWPSIGRALFPAADISVATQTVIHDVQPGDQKVLARTLLEVTADLRGEIPDTVQLVYSTSDRRIVDEVVEMKDSGEGLKRYRCTLRGENGDGLLQDLTYRVEAGDAVSSAYRVTVIQPPSATIERLHYEFPDYMERAPESPQGASIDTWEGTKITILAATNMSVQRAKIEFSEEEVFPVKCEELAMKVEDGTRLTAVWQPLIRDDKSYPRFYRIRCRTKDGASDPAPAIHTIEIQPDRGPDLTVPHPAEDLQVAANAIIPMLIRAEDPDFRLSRITLKSKYGPISLADQVLYRGNDTGKEIRYDLKLENLSLKTGDVLTWWVEARDNRLVESATRRLLENNVRQTTELKITIVKDAVSKEEVQEQFENDKEELEQKLDEAQHDPNEISETPDEPGRERPEREPLEPEEAQTPKSKTDEGSTEENQAQKQSGDDSDSEGQGGEAGDKPGSKKTDGDAQADGDQDSEKTQQSENSTKQNKTGTEQSPDSKSEGKPSNNRKLNNDGSDDDEVLRELLRDQEKREKQKNGSGEEKGDPQNDGVGEDSKNEEGTDGQSPKPGEESSKPGQDPSPDGTDPQKNDADRPGADPKSSEPEKGDTPTGSKPDPNQPKPEGRPPEQDPDKQKGKGGDSGDSPQKDADSDSDKQSPKGGSDGDKSSDMPPNGDPSNDASPQKSTDPSSDSKPGEKPNGTPDSPQESPQDTDPSGAQTQKDNPEGQPADPGKKDSNTPDDDAAAASEQKDDSNGKSGSSSGDKPGGKGGDSKSGGSGQKQGSKSGDGSDESKGDKSGSKSGGKSGDEKGDPKGPAGEKTDDPSAQKSDSKSGGKGGDESKQQGGEKPEGDKADGKGKPTDEEAPDKPGGEQSRSEGGKGGDKPGQKSDGAEGGKGKGKGKGGGKGSKGGSKPGTPGGEASGSGAGSKLSDQKRSDAKEKGPQLDRSGAQGDLTDPLNGSETSGSGGDAGDGDADAPNLDDRLEASDLVLKRLKEQLERGEADQELLDRLGWTKDDMRKFTDRLSEKLEQPPTDDPAGQARRRQFQEMLKSLDLKNGGTLRESGDGKRESKIDFSDLRKRVPRAYRKQFDEYRNRLSRQRQGSSD